MKKSLLLNVSVWILLLAAGAMAQGVPQHLDPATLVHLEGTVQSIRFVPAAGKPALILAIPDGTARTIQTAPYWFFEVSGFSLAEGDAVAVDAFGSTDPSVETLYAATIQNLAAGLELSLRDEAGLPLWMAGGPSGHGGQGAGQGSRNGGQGASQGQNGSGHGKQNGNGQGNGTGNGSGQGGNGQNGSGSGPAIDPSTAFTLAGTVESTQIALGRGQSSSFLLAANGVSYTVVLGPAWYLAANGFALAAGDAVEALVATGTGDCACQVAISITDLTTGESLVLRDESGLPLWKN